MPDPLDSKVVQIRGAEFAFGSWAVRLPAGIAYADIFDASIWKAIRKHLKPRGDRQPRKDDLLRIIGGDFDVVCVVVAVGDEGYQLAFYGGRKPSGVSQVLDDLSSLTAKTPDQAWTVATVRRWEAGGVSKDDLGTARRTFSKTAHPDAGTADGRRLAAANALLDKALDSLAGAA